MATTDRTADPKPKRPRNRVYVIADLHLGHAKVAEYRGFPTVEAHDDALVQAWNEKVGKHDVVYVLGDVFQLGRVPLLNGMKKLALGNHDQKPISNYVRLFSKVRAYFEFDGCLLSHIPVHPSQFGRYELNVHGHTHARHVDDIRYVSVSAEQCPGFRPVLLREVLEERRAVVKRVHPNTTACTGCGCAIDPDVCGCGATIYPDTLSHPHPVIPMGCMCYRDRRMNR